MIPEQSHIAGQSAAMASTALLWALTIIALPSVVCSSAMPKFDSEFDAQEWSLLPGLRTVAMYTANPPSGINANTGVMLVLHNWGGGYNDAHYIQWCNTFAERFNVIAVSINYLQSRDQEPTVIGEKPYDHGYLQAIDAIRAVFCIQKRLNDNNIAFNPHRTYAMGVSGGGNVALMANKLAPHTFACVVDIAGMPGLTDGIAYGTGEYGSTLNAGYSRDPASPAYLTKDMQEIRDPGNASHLEIQFKANPANKAIIIHGLDDTSCPVDYKIGIFRNMVRTGFRPDGHFITARDVDGTIVTDTGHQVGDRGQVLLRFADDYLIEHGKLAIATAGPNDFELVREVAFPTTNGRYVVDYTHGPPSISFRP